MPINFKIVEKAESENGTLFTLDVNGALLKLFFTDHALARIERWKLSQDDVIETLLFPEEVVTGHHARFIAHKRKNAHLIRAVYEYRAGISSLITVYYPYGERYYKGGGHFEDTILKRS